MKCYYYGEPSKWLLRCAFAAKEKARWARFPLAVVLVLLWAPLIPLAWLLVQAGELGHGIAGWCGFDSRDW